MNIQNHAELSKRKWDMARDIRNRYVGKTIPDAEKIAVHHLEDMAMEHARTAQIMKAHVDFIRVK